MQDVSDTKKGRPKFSFPDTDVIATKIKDEGILYATDLCREMGWATSTLNETLAERGDREFINDLLRENQHQLRMEKMGPGRQLVIHPKNEEIEEYGTTTPEEFATDGYEAEIDRLVSVIEHERSRGRSLANAIRKLEGKLYDMEHTHRELFEIANEVISRPAKTHFTTKTIAKDPAGGPWYCLAPIADVHAGKQVWGQEGWGKDYDIEEACRRIEDQGEQVAKYILSQPGECLGAYIPDVGDLFHAIDGQTQSGTYLHQDTRGKKVYEWTFAARRNALEAIRQVVPWMEIYESEGNHDHQWHSNFYHALEMLYLNADDVQVRRNHSRKVFINVGKAIHFFDHGKGVARLGTPASQNKVRITVEQRVPNSQLALAERIYFWCGHLHYREFTESGKYYIERLPSMAESDEYEEDLRVATPPGAVIYRLDMDGHVDATKNVYY